MTTRASYLALAERAERAEGADRELDFAIFRVLHPEYAGPEWRPYGGGLRHVNDSSDMRCLPPPKATPPRWTTSLDAALSLVPEGWGYELRRGHSGDRLALCRLWNGHGRFIDCVRIATPALALVAAALRARADEAKDG